ncbi:MAG TPA: Dabb family protein [Egibacteraceae bacterium]|nr:Dabb family protein [Egibacteraceae bacterium]
MLWHIVRFQFREDVPAEERAGAEDGLRSLVEAIPQITLLRLARAIDDERVTCLVTGFADAESYAVYAPHPAHVPVAARLRAACTDIVRLDFTTPDPPDALARTL